MRHARQVAEEAIVGIKMPYTEGFVPKLPMMKMEPVINEDK